MIVKTRAVVLREIKYREQSKICLLLTREFGQLSVILKGVRNPKNRLNGLFSAGNLLDTVIYKKNTRDIQLVSDAHLVLSPMTSTPHLDRFAMLYRVLDLARHASDHEEKNVPLFTLLATTIEKLCCAEQNFPAIMAAFLTRLISILGFEPSVEQCVFSRAELMSAITLDGLSELHFVQEPGGFALPGALALQDSQMRPVPATLYLLFRSFARNDSTCEAPDASPADITALCDILQEYCSRHMERLPHKKHLDIVARLLQA